MALQVWDLEFDDFNEAEMAAHTVTIREVRQVLENEPRFFANKRPHAATIVMIGPTYGGRLLAVPLLALGEPGYWRPATAWDADKEEQAKYRAAHERA